MTEKKFLGTLLCTLLIVLDVIQTALGAESGSLLSYSYLAVLVLSVFVGIMADYRNRFNDYLTVLFVITIILHFILTPDNFLSCILSLFIFLLFNNSFPNLSINHKFVANVGLVLLVICLLSTFPDFIYSINVFGRQDGYKGVFLNPNTNAIFALSIFSLCFMVKSRSLMQNFLLFGFALAYLVACQSRNALLFVAFTILFYFIQKTKLKKYTLLVFLACFVFFLVFMIVIEPSGFVSDYVLFGKNTDSAGRSAMILSVIDNFSINLFGNGKDAILHYFRQDDSTLHCFFINTLYGMGLIYLLIYMIFAYRIYKASSSMLTKAIWLAFNIYFFFEPGYAFHIGVANMLPILVVLLEINREKSVMQSPANAPSTQL